MEKGDPKADIADPQAGPNRYARQVQVMPKNLANRTTGEKVGPSQTRLQSIYVQTDMASWRKYPICYFKTVPVVA